MGASYRWQLRRRASQAALGARRSALGALASGAAQSGNPNGLKTDYLWKDVLTPAGLTDILENYAQVVETKHEKSGRKKRSQVFPRYHQLGVVRKALADVRANGAGKQH
jgi:type I restriction enzyme R subunit